jgi:small subunit ribosomal protein S17
MADSTVQTAKRKARKTRVGVVTSAHKTPKTISVQVQSHLPHVKYGKFIRRTQKLHAHDEKGEAYEGDRVEIMECRPISKTKTWRLVRVVEAAPRD